MENQQSCGSCSKCGCMCHKMVGLLVVLFGLLFLAQAFEWLGASTVAMTWPVLVVLAGLKCMMAGYCKCCSKG